jgi:DNA-binding transcriptional LysR family regulator
MIELRQLRYLIAASEAGSFSRAARNLNIKQATLSRHVLDVEKRLGITLFDRKTRGATLTKDGETYLRTAQRIVGEWDELNAWVRSTRNGEAGRLAVGFYTSFSAGNLRATLSEFGERHPKVKLCGFERDRKILLTGIENGLLDIAIMIGEASYRGLMRRPFWSERILVAIPEAHVLATRERIHWPDLTGERILLTEQDPGPETRNMLLGKLGMPGYSPEIVMDDIRRDTVLSVIALGGHISVVAESALGIHVPGVVFREVHDTNGHTRIGFSGYWREDNKNPVLRRFLEFVTARYSMPSVPGPQPPFQQPGKEPS